MSFLPAVVVLVIVVGLIVAVALALTPWRGAESRVADSEGSGEIESPLLRRPLRSRID